LQIEVLSHYSGKWPTKEVPLRNAFMLYVLEGMSTVDEMAIA